MKAFRLKAPYRLETARSLWDRSTAQWKTHLSLHPRLIRNNPKLLEKHSKFLSDYRFLLSKSIRIKSSIRATQNETEKSGPLNFLFFHYKLLEGEGFTDNQSPALKQLVEFGWDLVERYEFGQLTWPQFEDQVQRWYLLLSEKTAEGKKEMAHA